MLGAYLDPWDDYKLLFSGQFECSLKGVMVGDGDSIQSPLLRVGDDFFDGSGGVIGITRMNMKINLKAQGIHLSWF